MFNYAIEIRKLSKPMGKLMGFASLKIDDVMKIEGFRILDGTKGLFCAPPSHQGKGKNDAGETVPTWYDDITFGGEDGVAIKEEIYKNIVEAYLKESGSTAKQDAAQAQANVNEQAAPDGKKLW